MIVCFLRNSMLIHADTSWSVICESFQLSLYNYGFPFISLTIHTVWSCIAHLNKSMQLSIVYFDLQRSKFQGMVAASIASEFKPEKSTRLSRDFQEGSCLLLQIMCNPISSHAIFTFRLLIALSYVLFISLLEIYEHNIYATTLVITLTDSQFMSLELWQKKYKIKTMILE